MPSRHPGQAIVAVALLLCGPATGLTAAEWRSDSVAQADGENCVTAPHTPFCQRLLQLSGNRRPEFATPSAELEHRYMRDCIGPREEHTEMCRRLKHDAQAAAHSAAGNLDQQQLLKDACSAAMVQVNPALCDAMKQGVGPTGRRSAPGAAAKPGGAEDSDAGIRRIPAGDCDCDRIEGTCTARVSFTGRWITVNSSTPKCSWVQYWINGYPQSTTFKGGVVEEPFLGPATPLKLEVGRCRICKTGP